MKAGLIEKAEAACELIEAALQRSARPCVLWSAGKDAMVVLALARQVRPRIECVFWTLPFLRSKLDFAMRMQSEWNLTVHDGPPVSAALCRGNGRIDVMESYGLRNAGQTMVVARGTEEAGCRELGTGNYVCGVDWLNRPKAVTEFPFDLALHGHKSCDYDPLSGPIPLAVDAVQDPGGTETVFPLRNWSDAEVWDYTRAMQIPYDAGRYGKDGASLEDKGRNPDYYHACFRCCDASEGEFVSCPKRGGAVINSIADRVPWVEPRVPYCNLRKQGADNF